MGVLPDPPKSRKKKRAEPSTLLYSPRVIYSALRNFCPNWIKEKSLNSVGQLTFFRVPHCLPADYSGELHSCFYTHVSNNRLDLGKVSQPNVMDGVTYDAM